VLIFSHLPNLTKNDNLETSGGSNFVILDAENIDGVRNRLNVHLKTRARQVILKQFVFFIYQMAPKFDDSRAAN
jgi:hypothetical protein